MPLIYQSFIIEEKSLEAFLQKDVVPVAAWKKIRTELMEKGYLFLESNIETCGLPQTVLIGHQLSKDFKGDFYSRIEPLGLPYTSGHFYRPIAKSD